MKKRLLGTIAGLAFSAMSIINAHAVPAPEVTYDLVQNIFGFNLEEEGTLRQSLLLAVGMDHTTPESPFNKERIGIPFIVDAGPNFWVNRLKSGERQLEVMVNNALLLMFTKEVIPNQELVARRLLEAAAKQSYWPADFYIAEYNLTNQLTRDYQNPDLVRLPLKDNEALQVVARDTMERFNRCAAIGFAPCQYRIGFWLASNQETIGDGVHVLQQAIATTLADTRYKGRLEGAAINAARVIVQYGEQAGLPEDQITKTAEFIEAMQQDMIVETQDQTQ
jgi:hypothetical protein